MSIKLVSKSEVTLLSPPESICERIVMGCFYVLFAIAWLVIGIIRIAKYLDDKGTLCTQWVGSWIIKLTKKKKKENDYELPPHF